MPPLVLLLWLLSCGLLIAGCSLATAAAAFVLANVCAVAFVAGAAEAQSR